MDDFTQLPSLGQEREEESAGVSTEETIDEVTAESAVVGEERTDEGTEKTEDTETTVPQPDKLAEVLETQQLLLERMDSMNNLFSERIMHTDYEEKIIDQMHRELQKYKEDIYAQLIRPILLDVIEVRDSIMRMAAVFLEKPEGEQCIPNKTFADYAFDLQDILEKNDVEIYRSKVGDDFVPTRQRIIKKTPTSDETMHGKVAESLSCGYSYGGKTISTEKIAVYYYEKPVEVTEKNEVVENG